MQAVRFGPHRGTDWLHRVAWDPMGPTPFFERFTLLCQDPKHPRTLWVTLSITHDAQGPMARCAALYIDRGRGTHWLAEEAWPMDRAAIDPMRPGFGVGECSMGAAWGQGLVRTGQVALGWRMEAEHPHEPVAVMGRDRLYVGRLMSRKVALGVPSATVKNGFIEVWHTQGRYADKERIDCAGWQLSQTHVFGHDRPGHLVHVHVPETPGEAGAPSLDVFCTDVTVARMARTTLLMAAWCTGGHSEVMRTWRYGGVVPEAQAMQAPWQFTVAHQGSVWRGEVLPSRDEAVMTEHAPHHAPFALSDGATVRASVTGPDGETRTVVSHRAFVAVSSSGVTT